jgi:hypothetical protein
LLVISTQRVVPRGHHFQCRSVFFFKKHHHRHRFFMCFRIGRFEFFGHGDRGTGGNGGFDRGVGVGEHSGPRNGGGAGDNDRQNRQRDR